MSQPSNAVALEVCVDSLTSGLIAARLGAARIEINSALELGGLTCSIGLVEAVVQQVKPLGCAVIAMVRPRPGGFAYGAEEQRVMKRDIQALIRAGVDGIALGVLKPTGGVDAEAVRQLIKPVLAAGKQAVFHRAFDLVPNPVAALQTLIKLGVTRVLTSGQAPTAIEGAALIRRLIEQADGQIEVLPGSGITPSNVMQLIRETGCDQVHGSLSHEMEDTSGVNQPSIQFASPPPENLGYRQVDPTKVEAVMDTLHKAGNDPDR